MGGEPINPEEDSGASIYQGLISSVTGEERSPEEIVGPGRRPSLKVFFIETSISPHELLSHVEALSESSTKLRNFVEEYHTEILEKEDPYWLLRITDRRYKENYYFLIRCSRGRLWEVLTLAPSDIVKKTLRRVIEEVRHLDFAWVSRTRLIEIVNAVIEPESVRGFVAKRDSINSPKKVTMVVYGGDRADLQNAQKYFSSEPTSIYFRRENSPQAAVVGMVASEGYLRIDSVQPGSALLFDQLRDELMQRFEESYDNVVSLDGAEAREPVVFRDDIIATQAPEFKANIFSIPQRGWDQKRIEGAIVQHFVQDRKDFIGYKWGEGVYLVYDLEFGGSFAIRVKPEDRQVIISPGEGATKRSFSHICSDFIELIEHSADIDAVTGDANGSQEENQ